MGVGILISAYHCTWECWYLLAIVHTQRSIWRSMGVGFLISSYHCTHSRSIWSSTGVEILISSYHCTLKGQVEVPWGWEIWYLLTGVHTQCQFEVPWRWEFWYLLTIVRTQRFIWSSTGVGFFSHLLTILHTQGQFEVPRGWKFWYLLTIVHTQGQFEVHGVSQGSACDHREGVRSCAIRRPALHKRSCTIREVAYLQSGWCRIAQLDIQCIRKGQGVQWMLNVMLYGLRWK